MSSPQSAPDEEAITYTTPPNSRARLWRRFSGKTRRKVGWGESVKAIITVSCKPLTVTPSNYYLTELDALYAGVTSWLIFIPIAWVSKYKHWGHGDTFACTWWKYFRFISS